MTETNSSKVDHINLFEIFKIAWSHKLLIATCISFAIGFGSFVISGMEKKYTAKAIFKLETPSGNSSIPMNEDIGAIAALAGIGGLSTDSTDVLLERMLNKEFILKTSKELSLEDDKFFNTYKAPSVDPLWKSKIKSFLGRNVIERDHSQYITATIVRNYLANVKLEKTEAGAIEISLSHKDAKKASEYANLIMDIVKKLIKTEKQAASDERLAYLTETLADALQEVETSEKNLKEFSLNNTFRAEESFVSSSLELDKLRMERKEVREISSVLNVIQTYINNGSLDTSSYKKLRADYPLVDDVKFRQILGMSETISDWTWPERDTINAVLTTLNNRVRRLDIDIGNIEEEAESYAFSSGELIRLRRNSTIAEATYTVLIEQVKSQALIAGFKPETFRIYTYATPPLRPSSPKINVILAVSFLLGMLLGLILSFINAFRRGVFYSGSTMLTSAQPLHYLKLKKLRQLSRKSISEIQKRLVGLKSPELDEATISLSKHDIIFVVNTGSRISAAGMSHILATHSASTGKQVAVIDMSQNQKGHYSPKQDIGHFDMKFDSTEFGVSTLNITDDIHKTSFFTSKILGERIQELLSKFDQIFICTNEKEVISKAKALNQFNPSLVILSRIRKTRKKYIEMLKQKLSIEIMFYE